MGSNKCYAVHNLGKSMLQKICFKYSSTDEYIQNAQEHIKPLSPQGNISLDDGLRIVPMRQWQVLQSTLSWFPELSEQRSFLSRSKLSSAPQNIGSTILTNWLLPS